MAKSVFIAGPKDGPTEFLNDAAGNPGGEPRDSAITKFKQERSHELHSIGVPLDSRAMIPHGPRVTPFQVQEPKPSTRGILLRCKTKSFKLTQSNLIQN